MSSEGSTYGGPIWCPTSKTPSEKRDTFSPKAFEFGCFYSAKDWERMRRRSSPALRSGILLALGLGSIELRDSIKVLLSSHELEANFIGIFMVSYSKV